LTSRYFEELTTFSRKDGSTIRKLSKEREAPAYIWHSNYKKAYRHRIGHGVFMIHNFGERLARPMLLSHPGSMSDYCEQTFARVGSYKEKAVIEAAHSIYTDEGMAIRGASSGRRWGLRHLHREVAQCLVNYEMHEMNTDELLAFLPADFKKRGFLSWVPDAKLAASVIEAAWTGQCPDEPPSDVYCGVADVWAVGLAAAIARPCVLDLLSWLAAASNLLVGGHSKLQISSAQMVIPAAKQAMRLHSGGAARLWRRRWRSPGLRPKSAVASATRIACRSAVVMVWCLLWSKPQMASGSPARWASRMV
jgi:hypothetical protein